jgi:tRNA nucleotidyltransferase/poly(A) polymerase
MKRPLIIILTLLATTPASADTPPTRTVGSEQQASRDNEKLNILQSEINEQQQLAAQLQQQKAIDLANDNKEELAKTEARLEEVTGNITQIQQEIKIAQSQSVTVRLNTPHGAEPTKTAKNEIEQPNAKTGQWWDLYNKN